MKRFILFSFLISAFSIKSISQVDFIMPDTVCVNDTVKIQNITPEGSYFSWNFCMPDVNNTPTATSLGNPGGLMNVNTFSDIALDTMTGNYHMFVTNYFARNIVRLDFGTSPLNTPTAVDLGTFAGILPPELEGIQIVKEAGNWYALVVGGQSVANARLIRLDFGTSLTNTPTATNLGNIGTMAWPTDYQIVKDGNNWYGVAANRANSRISIHDFGTSITNTPTGNSFLITGPNSPCNMMAIKDGANWHVFVTCLFNAVVRLDYGNSLANAPTMTNLGTLGGTLNALPRGIIILKDCNKYIGYIGHENGVTLKLEFPLGLTGAITVTTLNNINGIYQKLHEYTPITYNGTLYLFTADYGTNSIQRMNINLCTSSPVPSSNNYNPPAYVYSQSGVYDVTLIVDEGRGIPGTMCKKITVLPNDTTSIAATICSGNTYTLPWGPQTGVSGVYNNLLQNKYGCDSIISVVLTVTAPIVNTINTSICQGGSYTLPWPPNTVVSLAGSYSDSTTTAAGCDSITVVNLSITPAPIVTVNASICPGNTYTLPNGNVVSAAGVYNTTITKPGGCDTVISTNLNFYTISNVNQNVTICSGNTYTLPGGAVVSNAGVYTDTLTDKNGCDSIITISLSVSPAPITTQNAEICEGESYVLPGGGVAVEAGSYSDTLTTNLGCDTIINTNLTLKPLFLSQTELPNVFTPNEDGNNDVFYLNLSNDCVAEFNMLVYNRWGLKVFESDKPTVEWDGRISSGTKASDGTYFYMIKIISFTGEEIEKSGFVNVIR